MADEWGPWSLRTSTRPSRETAWPTGSVIPIDVDDQAPIPLLVGIALALVIGFIIIVYCICRRHNLLGGASGPQDPNAAYQRAPTGDGTGGGGGYNTGVGVNAYPMAPVKPMFPPPPGTQTVAGLPGKSVAGGMNMGPPLQPPHQPPHPPPASPGRLPSPAPGLVHPAVPCGLRPPPRLHAHLPVFPHLLCLGARILGPGTLGVLLLLAPGPGPCPLRDDDPGPHGPLLLSGAGAGGGGELGSILVSAPRVGSRGEAASPRGGRWEEVKVTGVVPA